MSENLQRVIAVGMVRDEADVIEHTIRHLLAQGVDGVLIADNLSTDETPAILGRLAAETRGKISPVIDRDPAYYQSRKISQLAERAARHHGADWIIPFDADELLVTAGGCKVADVIRNQPADIEAVLVSMINHFPTYLDDPAEANPFKRIKYRHLPGNRLPKVIVRYWPGLMIEQGNHSALMKGRAPVTASSAIQIRHFPYRSEEQFIRKVLNGAAAYKATDLPEHLGQHWRDYGRTYERAGEEGLREHFRRWFLFGPERMDELAFDPAPLI